VWNSDCAVPVRLIAGNIVALQLLGLGLAVSFGFAAASLMRWLYVLLTGETLGLRHLREPGIAQPLRAIAVVASGPDIMLGWGLRQWGRRPAAGSLAIAASLLWSFMMGVVILTKLFGFT
jgi:hypothetical protein